MAMNNLSTEGEFRYIIQWFNEWSELQREDFVPVLVEYILQGGTGQIYMNGMVNSVAHTGIQDKPMSLFQCRIKLFREWNKKWPLEMKHKLQEKIFEIDSKVGEKITNEIKSHGGEQLNIPVNGCNGDGADREAPIEVEVKSGEPATCVEITEKLAEAAEEAINFDSQIVEALNNETPVDDNITTENTDNATVDAITEPTVVTVNTLIDTQLSLEPADQVQMQTQSVLEENCVLNDCSATTTATVA